VTRRDQGRDRAGREALHYAALEGDLPGVQSALAAGADPDSADRAGWTPLHFAAQAQSSPVIEALLAGGADADPVDNHGNTPLWRAVFDYRGIPAAIEALLAAGADPDRQNAHGVSPQQLADRVASTSCPLRDGELPRRGQ
jgi:ankyrin repeat protein